MKVAIASKHHSSTVTVQMQKQLLSLYVQLHNRAGLIQLLETEMPPILSKILHWEFVLVQINLYKLRAQIPVYQLNNLLRSVPDDLS